MSDVHEHLRACNLNLQAIAYAWDPKILPQDALLAYADEDAA